MTTARHLETLMGHAHTTRPRPATPPASTEVDDQIAGPYSIGSDFWPGASRVIEEAGELIQVLGKLIGAAGDVNHWDGSNLHVRLVEELGDVLGAVEFFVHASGLSAAEVRSRASAKVAQYRKWHGLDVEKVTTDGQ